MNDQDKLLQFLDKLESADKQRVLAAVNGILDQKKGNEEFDVALAQVVPQVEECLDNPSKIENIVLGFVDQVLEVVPEVKKKLNIKTITITPEIVQEIEDSIQKKLEDIINIQQFNGDYSIEINGILYQERLSNLCSRIAVKYINAPLRGEGLKILKAIKNNENIDGIKNSYCEQKVKSESQENNLNQDTAIKIESSIGISLSTVSNLGQRGDIIYDILVDGIQWKEPLRSLCTRLSNKYLGKKNATRGLEILIRIRDGEDISMAAKKVKEADLKIKPILRIEEVLNSDIATLITKNIGCSFDQVTNIWDNKIEYSIKVGEYIYTEKLVNLCIRLSGKERHAPDGLKILEFMEKGISTIHEAKKLITKPVINTKNRIAYNYTIDDLMEVAKIWGAKKLRDNKSEQEIIFKASEPHSKDIKYINLLYSIIYKSDSIRSIISAREFMALLAEGYSESDAQEMVISLEDKLKTDFYTDEVLYRFSEEWKGKIRKLPTNSNQKIILRTQKHTKTTTFEKLIKSILIRKKANSFIGVREYLASLCEKPAEEDLAKTIREIDEERNTDYFTFEVLANTAKSWGSNKIRNTPVNSIESLYLKSNGINKEVLYRSLLKSIKKRYFIIHSYVQAREFLALFAENFSEEDAIKIIKDESESNEFLKEQEVQQKKQLQDLEDLLKESEEGATLRGEEVHKLRQLFGDAHLVDILYLHDKSFQGIPVESVKSIISEFLGNTRSTFGFGGIEGIEESPLPKSLPPSLKKVLIEVLKADALHFYNQQKKAGSEEEDTEIILNYLSEKDETFSKLKYDYLQDVMKEAFDYYISLFESLKKPEYIVEQVKEGRLFPDINQLINIQETKDKKRMLIADEMGMGKSASAILTKEMLELGTALVVVPSNVVSTWEDYLSDKVSENGERKQIGYFKPGYAPRVFTIESTEDIKNNDLSSFDYVILSHHRLNDEYTTLLQEYNFDHLIIDEVHKVKNVEHGQWSKSVLELSQQIHGSEKYMTLLSGTPIPNKVKDIAMLLKLLHPDKFSDTDPKLLTQQIIEGELLNLRSLLVDNMQMKDLQESISLPEMEAILCNIQLTGEEADFYDALLEEEDELTPTEKITLLRKFLLNPASIDTTPNIEGAKINYLNKELESFFQEKNKLVGFVNDYVQDILEGDNSLVERLNVPAGVNLYVIHGETPQAKRREIQKRLNETDERMLVIVSGKTADVGVDYSGAEEAWQINQPWTKSDERQQIGRVYRPGQKNNIKVKTFIVEGSLENAIREYIEQKEIVVKKLLKGFSLSELDKRMLRKDENIMESKDFEINPELAKEYLSVTQRLNKMFGTTKRQGEEHFRKFSDLYGDDYAECYRALGRRSYEANNARVSAQLLRLMITERNQNIENLEILDLASGPEMLSRHSREDIQKSIHSVDILEQHFEDSDSQNFSVGSYLDIPKENKSIDYCNFGLAFHHMKLHFKDETYEPVKAFMEMNRVLKTGGRVMISFIHSMELRDFDLFEKLIQDLGFKIVKNYSGQASHQGIYETEFITLEKVVETPVDVTDEDFEETVEILGKERVKGFHWNNVKNGRKTSTRKDIIDAFTFKGKNIQIDLNEEDQKVLAEEQAIVNLSKELKKKYERIENIPDEEILENNFIRYRVKSGLYRLFKKLEGKNGAIITK